MKVKEIARTANVAWSPATMQDVHIACGTVAQQLDATFRYTTATKILIIATKNPRNSNFALKTVFLSNCLSISLLFSTSARLEVFSMDLASPGHSVPLAGTVESPLRSDYFDTYLVISSVFPPKGGEGAQHPLFTCVHTTQDGSMS